MNSFMSWVGGKKALRESIVLRLPQDCDRYVEVFGGGGWVLFYKAPSKFEVYGEKKKLYFELGKLIAHINQIEIDKEHPSVSCRGLWEEYFTEELLKKQLNRIVQNGLISEKKVQLLCSQMKTLKAKNSLSLIHRDIRPDNIIYDNGKMFVIDAEYCEVGDPLDEIARMELEWNFNEMFDSVLEGYKSVLKADTDSVLYLFYKLEWLAELLDMHYNHNCMNSSTKKFLNEFNHILTKLLH